MGDMNGLGHSLISSAAAWAAALDFRGILALAESALKAQRKLFAGCITWSLDLKTRDCVFSCHVLCHVT